MAQSEIRHEFNNQRKLQVLSKFEYLIRQLNQHGVDTTNVNPE